MVTMTSYREQCSFSLLRPVYFSGEVANIAHLSLSQKRSQNASSECRKERVHKERKARGQELLVMWMLLLACSSCSRRDLLLLRAVSLLASTDFTFVREAI